MVDANKNGIPDDRERKYGVSGTGKSPYPSGMAPKVASKTASPQVTEPTIADPSQSPWLSPYGAIGEIAKGIGGLFGMGGPAKKSNAPGPGKLVGPKLVSAKPTVPVETEKSFADYLSEAMSLIGGGSGGQIPGINYDPQRETLRGQAAENDARLEAMYRQLRGSIDADAPVLQDAYQGAIDNTSKITQDAQAQTQGATDAALAQQNSVLQALGIQEAQGNQIRQGTDLSTQTAQQIGDQATRGQAAGTRLASNEATALAHNTNIGNAAGLEGNLQRASNNARLQALLADIDMQEQQQNQSVAAANASAGQNGLSQQLSLAQQLYGMDQDKQSRQDQLQMAAQEAASQQGEQLPDLNAMLQKLASLGIGIPEDPRDLASLLDVARRYQ